MAYNYYNSKGELDTRYPTYTGKGVTGVFREMLYGHRSGNMAELSATRTKPKEVINRKGFKFPYDSFQGKNFIITGATGDIGSMVSRILIKKGANVVLFG